ncbi:potassium transporter Kef [Vibrio parahaemolyticus]|nr:potassium transporter Kef [Vibrio parahaemolyticus]
MFQWIATMYRPKVPEHITSFQLAVLVLSVLVVSLALAIELVFNLPSDVLQILIYVDTFICAIFIIDFVQQYRAAPSKLEYMKWGWRDLISCIPLIE